MSDGIKLAEGIKRHTIVPESSSSELAPGSVEDVREFLAFSLAHEDYALPLASIREILKPPPITPVPRAPRDVLGIISVRGRITTILDLRRRLRLEEAPVGKHSRVLLVDSGSEILGLLVDRVIQVYRLLDDEVELAAVVSGDLSEYFMGIGRPHVGKAAREHSATASRGDILILLDPGPLLKG